MRMKMLGELVLELPNAWLLTALLCVACGGADRGSDNDVAADDHIAIPDDHGDPDAVTADDLRKRELQLLVHTQEGATQYERSAQEVALSAQYDCAATLTASPMQLPSDCAANNTLTEVGPPGTGTCVQQLCRTQLKVCVANRLLEIATAVAPVSLNGGKMVVAPQSTASNAALAEQAVKTAREGLTHAGYALLGMSSNAAPAAGAAAPTYCHQGVAGTTFGTGDAQQTYAASLASSFAESYQTLWEAGTLAVQHNVAAADEAWSRYPSTRKAAYFAQVAPILSRAHATHVLIGRPMAPASMTAAPPEAPLCDADEPSAPAKTALQLLRLSAFSPARLATTVSTSDLLTGGADSVRSRVAELMGMPAWANDSAGAFAARFGLELSDFTEAQQFMRAQHKAFGRSGTATLAATPLPGGGTSSFVRYAATANPPAPVSRLFAAELVQRSPSYVDDRDSGSLNQPNPNVIPIMPAYTERGVAPTIDHALTFASIILSAASVHQDIARILSPLHTLGLSQRPYRMQVCLNRATVNGAVTNQYLLKMYGQSLSGVQSIRLVRGRDGLECATRGTVDGAPCTLSSYVLNGTSTNAPLNTGFTNYQQWTSNESTSFYAVRLRAGLTADLPGAYEEVSGFTPSNASGTTQGIQYCTLVPAVPELGKQAGDTVAPSVNGCAEPEQTCAGLPLSQRIPLEDELSDDGDAYESSWRHYLALAKQAAEEADALGEDVIARGLEMDVRAETSLEKIEELCGVAVNNDDLFKPDLTDAVLANCTQQADCSAGYLCTAGKCRKDLASQLSTGAASDADQARLEECLGAGSTLPFAALGSEPVCVWHLSGNPTRLCEGASKDKPCPYLADTTTDTPTCGMTPPPGNTTALVSSTLGLFVSSTLQRGGGRPPCEEIRRLRSSDHPLDERRADWDALVASNYFDPQHVRELASRLSWEARIGNFSAVRFDGVELVNTGNIRGPVPSVWPCTSTRPAGMPAPTCPAGSRSVWCAAPVDCSSHTSNVDARVRLNDRLARAVLAAKLSSGVSLEDLELPLIHVGKEAGLKATSDYTVPGGAARVGITNGVYFDGFLGEDWIAYERAPQKAECLSGGGLVGWSVVKPDGTLRHITTRCRGGRAEGAFVTFPAALGLPARAIELGSAIWSGLGQRPVSSVGMGALVRGSLFNQGSRDQIVLDRDADSIRDLTNYYRFQYIDDGFEENFTDNELTHQNGPIKGAAGAVAETGLTRANLLDAAELLCEAGRARPPACDLSQVPRLQSADDLPALRTYLSCTAAGIESQATLTVFANFPKRAMDALVTSPPNGAYPVTGGKYASTVATLRTNLVELGALPSHVASTLRQFETHLQRLEIGLKRLEIRKQITDLEFYSQVASAMTNCASGLGSAGPSGLTGFQKFATCAGALAQVAIASKIRDLTKDDLGLEGDDQLAAFQDDFERFAEELQMASTSMLAKLEQMDGLLAELEEIRREGTRQLSNATFADSDAFGRHYHVNTVIRRRYNTALRRYLDARDDAIRMTYLAKRAVEMRIGMNLADMREDLSLVAAPRSWEASLCTMSGIDYARIRDASELPADNFADGYIGDYVDRLQRVVDSYLVDFPSHDGHDFAVVSLRDEILDVRASCEVEVHNMLLHASALDQPADEATGEKGYHADTCRLVPAQDERTCLVDTDCACAGGDPCYDRCVAGRCGLDADGDGSADTRIHHCAQAIALGEVPVPTPTPELATPSAYELRFGVPGSTDPLSLSYIQGSSAWVQTLELPAGRYRYSYFVDLTRSTPHDVVVREADDAEVALSQVAEDVVPGSTFVRRWVLFDLPTASRVRIGVAPVTAGSIFMAAPMLEDVTRVVIGQSPDPSVYPPRSFVDTGDTTTRALPVCEDTSGEVFRSTAWTRSCVRLCADGYRRECLSGSGTLSCYWETELSVSQSDIEHGRIVRSGGFARGNYDYRIDAIGLNVVGSDARSCADSQLPSTCYAAGNVAYSMEHVGPYVLRNHRGEDYTAPLFTARIEHARALAAERYVSNPISSADQHLIEPYLRRELRGRPLHGKLVLRVWDEEGTNFEGIRDIQLLLEYRYRTRFE